MDEEKGWLASRVSDSQIGDSALGQLDETAGDLCSRAARGPLRRFGDGRQTSPCRVATSRNPVSASVNLFIGPRYPRSRVL